MENGFYTAHEVAVKSKNHINKENDYDHIRGKGTVHP